VSTTPDSSGSALVISKDVPSVQEVLLWDGKNMKDHVISVSVPSKSQLTLLSDRDLGLGDKSKAMELNTLKEWFKQLDTNDIILLLQKLAKVI